MVSEQEPQPELEMGKKQEKTVISDFTGRQGIRGLTTGSELLWTTICRLTFGVFYGFNSIGARRFEETPVLPRGGERQPQPERWPLHRARRFLQPQARQEEELRLDDARIDYWMSKGAKPSERVANLIKGARKTAAYGSQHDDDLICVGHNPWHKGWVRVFSNTTRAKT